MQITIPYNFDPTLRQGQHDIFADPRKNKVVVVHRRFGKTSVALNYLITEAMLNKNRIYLYLCPTQRQAKDVAWKDPDMLPKYLPSEIVERKNEVELTIWLKGTGSQIYIRGADNPDGLRGLNPYGIILDEYAQMKSEVYEEVFKPAILANGGWVWFVGTPKGKNDFYRKYRMALDNPAKWQVVHLKASESGIIPAAALEEARKTSSQQIFSQEYEVEFLEGEGTVFRRIRENVQPTLSEPMQGREYQMGVDLARLQDWTVMTVIDRHTHNVVHFDRFQHIDWNLQKARIEATARRYNLARIKIDATGLGDAVAEDLRRTGLIVEDFKFTNESKKNLIDNLAVQIEQNKIRYPEIPELLRELEEFTYEMSATGKIRYTAPDGAHDDCVCSIGLASWQLGEKLPLRDGVNRQKNYGFTVNLQPKKGYSKPIFR